MRFPSAAKGVTKIFIAEIMTFFTYVISGVLAVFIMPAGEVESIDFSDGLSSVESLILIFVGCFGVLTLLAVIFRIIGYIQAARDEEYFTRAIIFAIISFVLTGISGFLQTKSGVVGDWISTIVMSIAQLMNLFVFTSTLNGLMELSYQCRRDDLVRRGSTVHKLISTIFVLSICLIILNRVFRLFISGSIISTIILVASVIIILLVIIGYFLYFGYLGKVSKMLRRS